MEKKFKIVQMLPALGFGGAQVFCIQLCNELARYPGYEVTLISMYHHDAQNHLPLSMLDTNVKFLTLGKRKGLDPKIFVRIYKLLKQIGPDVVHTHLHSGYYCFLAYWFSSNAFRKVHTFHNLAKEDAPIHGRKGYYYFFRKGVVQPVSISDEVHKSALEEYRDCGIVQINNGSAPVTPTAAFEETRSFINKLKKNSNTKVLVNVARISKQKNQRLLLEAMDRLNKEGANVCAVIVGDYVPDDKKLYEELMAKKPDNVHFVGKVTNVADYLLNADAFVLSSAFEGLPISLLEAMAVGIVPVCTPVGGMIGIVKPEVGFLSSDLSTESYLTAIKSFLNTGESGIQKLRHNLKALFQKDFSMENCAQKYNTLYRSLSV